MNLLILEARAEDYRKPLQAKFPDVTIHAATKEEDVGDFIEKADILLGIRISDEMIKRAKKLQWIQALTTGVDYIINLPSLRKDIIITSSRGIHGPQMSEMAFLLMLALNSNFPQIVRNQDQSLWDKWPRKLLFQKKIGILGIGVIGEEIAKKAKVFGMTVYWMDIIKRKVDAVDHFLGPEDMMQVAKEVDYLVLVAPRTPQTEGIVNAKVLAAMKPTAFLINIGRGELVVEEDLVKTMKEGKIAGAALDAFNQEPLPSSHPFWKMKNVFITPHVGGVSDIYVEQALEVFEENLRRYLKGDKKNLMNVQPRG
jgi:D-2-hydroxyacid dehydrogenase (NADP+)